MPDLTDLFHQVNQAENDIIALEQALVRIPSVNTGFMAHRRRDASMRTGP